MFKPEMLQSFHHSNFGQKTFYLFIYRFIYVLLFLLILFLWIINEI